jgi:hypothetical protein
MRRPWARRALAMSNCARMPSCSTAIALASTGASCSWREARVDLDLQRVTVAGVGERVAQHRRGTGVIVIAGGVRSGAGRPSRACSSPEFTICSMMSLPPTRSPPT